MKVVGQERLTVSGLDQEKTSAFSIDGDSIGFIMDILAQYKHPVQSIVRELTSNALDAHIEAGVDKDVHVGIKGNKFFVQDFGVGMSPEFVDKIYTAYGASTKRDSNEQMGAFGLGSKSPFGYTNEFYIVSVKDGVERRYMMFREEEIPNYNLVYELETDKENGVRIEVPIELGEKHLFKNAVRNQLRYMYGVSFFNCDIEDFYIFKGEHFVFNPISLDGYNNKIHVCLKNVYYELDFDQLDLYRYQNTFPVGLYFDVGELDIIPTREGLKYTKRTKDAIADKYEAAYYELDDLHKSQIPEINDPLNDIPVENVSGIDFTTPNGQVFNVNENYDGKHFSSPPIRGSVLDDIIPSNMVEKEEYVDNVNLQMLLNYVVPFEAYTIVRSTGYDEYEYIRSGYSLSDKIKVLTNVNTYYTFSGSSKNKALQALKDNDFEDICLIKPLNNASSEEELKSKISYDVTNALGLSLVINNGKFISDSVNDADVFQEMYENAIALKMRMIKHFFKDFDAIEPEEGLIEELTKDKPKTKIKVNDESDKFPVKQVELSNSYDSITKYSIEYFSWSDLINGNVPKHRIAYGVYQPVKYVFSDSDDDEFLQTLYRFNKKAFSNSNFRFLKLAKSRLDAFGELDCSMTIKEYLSQTRIDRYFNEFDFVDTVMNPTTTFKIGDGEYTLPDHIRVVFRTIFRNNHYHRILGTLTSNPNLPNPDERLIRAIKKLKNYKDHYNSSIYTDKYYIKTVRNNLEERRGYSLLDFNLEKELFDVIATINYYYRVFIISDIHDELITSQTSADIIGDTFNQKINPSLRLRNEILELNKDNDE